MSHPGFNSPQLADMRRVLDEVPLSDRDHRDVEWALAEIETEWQGKHRDSYTAGVAARDVQHDEVLTVAEQFQERVAEAIEDVRNGRRSAKEVRSWLRDVNADHSRLTDQHRGIERRDEHLTEYEAMTPDQYQAEHLERFPLLARSAPTLALKVAQRASKPRRDFAATDQDALVRELEGKPPSSGRPRVGGEWR